MIKKIIQLFKSVPDPSTPPTSPELIEAMCDENGAIYSKLTANVLNGTPNIAVVEAVRNNTDNITLNTGTFSVASFSINALFDPESLYYQREKTNHNLTILASAARTATTVGSLTNNFSERGVYFITNITAGAGYSIQPELQIQDVTSGNYISVATGAALTASGTYLFKIYPGITEIAGFAYSMALPRYWRFRMVHGNANSVTYSVSGQVLK